jgi:hypothetical protein
VKTLQLNAPATELSGVVRSDRNPLRQAGRELSCLRQVRRRSALALKTDPSFIARLDRMQISYRVQKLPDGSMRQCFIRDPNGARLEITGR